MSRSRRKRPYHGMTTSRSEKSAKRAWHQRWRSAVRAAIARGDDPPSHREHSNPWRMPKDGFVIWHRGDAVRKGKLKEWERMMRK